MKVFYKSFLVLALGLISLSVSAQEYSDAVKLYNEGLVQAQSKKYEAAINSFTQAISIGEQLGTDQGTSIKDQAERQIPKMYYQNAVVSFNAFKKSKKVVDLDDAINSFGETAQVAKEYGDTDISKRSLNVIPQLYYQKATMLYNREDFDGANAALDKAINANANYAVAYYQKGLVLKKASPDDLDGILNWFNQAITVAEKVNDSRVARSAKSSAHDELLFRGAKSTEAKKYSQSVELLELATTYNESADVYYRLAEVLNKQGKSDAALTNAAKALTLEQGGKTDKAKIYFEIGLAHQRKGTTGQACQAFGNALFGSFKAPAQHIMEFELKCKSS